MSRSFKEFIYFNKKGIISFVLVLLVIGGSILTFIITSPKNKVEAEEEIVLNEEEKVEIKEEKKNDDKKECYFDIKGKVKSEGVYKLDCNSRVIDAINIAGGITKDADTSVINLSKKINDGMVIKVYSKTEVKNYLKTLESDTKKEELCINDQVNNDACIDNKTNNVISNNLININTASIEELMSLDGIGESKANAIIKYRNKTPFKNIEEIKNVEGIGEAMYAKIKENITI